MKCWISENATIEKGAQIGVNCRIHPGVFISSACEIIDNVEIFPNTVFGVAGAAHEKDSHGEYVHIPHFGRLIIGKNTRVGANSVICRGTIENTVIGEGCSIGHRIGVGHNCLIADKVFIGAGSTLAGSVRLGSEAWVAPGCQILNKKNIGAGAIVGIGSVVVTDVESNSTVFGNPAAKVRFTDKKLNRRN